ncbi:MAG: SMC-Scp complex subunit ScpB [Planctomycetaceae bacterium]|nr:SMC-Scp complex subunit ScpB [Planctomycetaceae bacterium]
MKNPTAKYRMEWTKICRPSSVCGGFRSVAKSPLSSLLFFSGVAAEACSERSRICEDEELPQETPIVPFNMDVRTGAMSKLEAVLFIAREPLPVRRLVQLAVLPEGSRPKTLLRELNNRYVRQGSSFRIVEVAGGYQLRTLPEFAPWLIRMQEVPTTVKLSQPVMEVLAIIADKQPVLRSEIERLRGVQCGEIIRQLLDRGLIKITGRSEELGRPFYYGTTKMFLEVFGINSLEEAGVPAK